MVLFQQKTQRCHGRRYDVTCTHQNVTCGHNLFMT